MKKIIYRNLNETVNGIKDEYADWGLVAKDLGRQIFERYDYLPTINNFGVFMFEEGLRRISEDGDRGINDMVSFNDVPADDLFKFKRINHLTRYRDYVIDYKSNNNNHPDSVYVKLMPFMGFKAYEEGKVIKRIERERRYLKKKRKKGTESKYIRKNRLEEIYGNKYILGSRNITDYFFYVQFTKENMSKSTLKTAHLVPAEQLRHQVAEILNNILEKEGYEHLIELRKDGLFLNHKITKAYQICKEKPQPPKHQIELFKLPRGDITLRIPDHLLTSHFKFNEFGDIIN